MGEEGERDASVCQPDRRDASTARATTLRVCIATAIDTPDT